jgi:hypothetical protein
MCASALGEHAISSGSRTRTANARSRSKPAARAADAFGRTMAPGFGLADAGTVAARHHARVYFGGCSPLSIQRIALSVLIGSGRSHSKHCNVRRPVPPASSVNVRLAPHLGQVGRPASPMTLSLPQSGGPSIPNEVQPGEFFSGLGTAVSRSSSSTIRARTSRSANGSSVSVSRTRS